MIGLASKSYESSRGEEILFVSGELWKGISEDMNQSLTHV